MCSQGPYNVLCCLKWPIFLKFSWIKQRNKTLECRPCWFDIVFISFVSTVKWSLEMGKSVWVFFWFFVVFFSSAFEQIKRCDCCNLPHHDNYFELWFRKLLWTLCAALVGHVIGFNGAAHHVEEKALHIHHSHVHNFLWTALLFMDRSNHVPFLSLSLSLSFFLIWPGNVRPKSMYKLTKKILNIWNNV